MYHFNLSELIQAGSLKELLSAFNRFTGLVVKGVGYKGQVVLQPEGQQEAPYCQLICSTPAGEARCRRAYARAGQEARKFGGPYLFRCHAGLLGWALPVAIDPEVGLTVVCGEAHLSPPDKEFPSMVLAVAQDLHLDPDRLLAASRQLKLISPQKAQSSVEMLYLMANYLARGQRTAMAAIVKGEWPSRRAVLMEREQELLLRVRSRDHAGAKEILQSLLNDLQDQESVDIHRFRSQVINLIVLLSRAAADLPGEDLSRVFTLNAQLIWQASQAPAEVLRQLPWQALETFCPPKGEEEVGPILGRALHFIYENYHQPHLTVEDIARAAYVSPSYLSHLFRRSMGESIIAYVTRLRVEMAKKLLREGSLGIREIGRRVGYPNPSYFTRVFKKIVQLSPREYQEQYYAAKKTE
ncbi:PocR ligand-binding domain-containing protein [Thermanaeromonas sp. C210]|uniref:PocR ligand-binding domain-containing protein n=1 Tax=Thermanaeromonas sp. C210 TaxID=2731925 RepID=UPI00155C4FA8|nr:PocR ligand-binding domain-containing protein [Thermanaeromonas sp. C210]GFN22646.1 histidine kinase [Thermanaeromonas sp. C210]